MYGFVDEGLGGKMVGVRFLGAGMLMMRGGVSEG